MVKRQRYKLAVTMVSGDILVVIHAEHKNKETLREARKLATMFIEQDKLIGVEAWDTKGNKLLGKRG